MLKGLAERTFGTAHSDGEREDDAICAQELKLQKKSCCAFDKCASAPCSRPCHLSIATLRPQGHVLSFAPSTLYRASLDKWAYRRRTVAARSVAETPPSWLALLRDEMGEFASKYAASSAPEVHPPKVVVGYDADGQLRVQTRPAREDIRVEIADVVADDGGEPEIAVELPSSGA